MDSAIEKPDHVRANDRQFVTALSRGLGILRAFRPEDGPLGNQELARRTGLPKPTISRLTYTLTQLGYLNYDRKVGVYSPGGGMLALGYVALAQLDVRRVARPFMQELADECGAAVALGARDRLDMLYLENCEGQNIVALRVTVGSRIPLGVSAMGRAYLAALTERERTPLIDQMLRKYPDDKAKLLRGIEKAFKDVEKRGFCTSIGEWRKDVNGAGAALALPNGAGLYALNCGGPAYLLKSRDIEEIYGPRLVEITRRVVSLVGVKGRG
ncbi:MAG: IclR family transcriptional regulator [Rhodoblastus sp.]